MAPSAAYNAVSFTARPTAAFSAGRRTAAVAGVVSHASTTGWAPLLGWSGKADYLEALAPVLAAQDEATARRQFLRVMTEEKARQLHAQMACLAGLLLSCRIMLWPKNL